MERAAALRPALSLRLLRIADWATWFALGCGAVLRIVSWLDQRSLWLDEVKLARLIKVSTFWGLLGHQEANQASPPGFLAAIQMIIRHVSTSELSFRFVPLLGGIASLLLFHRAVRTQLRGWTRFVVVALFALCDSLIYYSTELRPYSLDVAATLALLVLTEEAIRRKTIFSMGKLGLAGVILPWFSFAAVFSLIGSGLALVARLWQKREIRFARLSALCLAAWGGSLIGLYWVSVRFIVANEKLVNSFRDKFPIESDEKFVNVMKLPSQLFHATASATHLEMGGALLFAAVAGSLFMLRRRPTRAILLAVPIFVTLLLWAGHYYPFYGRFMLFAVPAFFLFAGELLRRLPRPQAIVLSVILLAPLLFQFGKRLDGPIHREEMKHVMEYRQLHHQPGDTTYLYHAARGPFDFYTDKFPVAAGAVVRGFGRMDSMKEYMQEIDGLRGLQRVWILFTHTHAPYSNFEKNFFLSYLDTVGEKLDEKEVLGASIYLFDLSRWSLDPVASRPEPRRRFPTEIATKKPKPPQSK